MPSPMPVHNYERPVEVVGEPYDYGVAGLNIHEVHPRESIRGSHFMQHSDKTEMLRQGAVVFVFLAVLTALEFFIAVAMGAVSLLVVVALIKFALVIYYYMHIYGSIRIASQDRALAGLQDRDKPVGIVAVPAFRFFRVRRLGGSTLQPAGPDAAAAQSVPWAGGYVGAAAFILLHESRRDCRWNTATVAASSWGSWLP